MISLLTTILATCVTSVPAAVEDVMPDQVAEALAQGATLLLLTQEGTDDAEWPYEGVYRVRAEEGDPRPLVNGRSAIPIGYRIGGTGICAEAMFQAPGYAEDPQRQEAVRKAVEFVCTANADKRMDPNGYTGNYDVRGWGYIYGLRMLLALRSAELVPEGMTETVDKTIRWYIEGLRIIQIPRLGGWNYAGTSGTSPFMTAPAVMALFDAKRQEFEVDDTMLERALDALARCVAPDGYVDYAAARQVKDDPGQIPGATGRMVASEAALFLAGRSDQARLLRAVDAFFEHWDALEVRRRKTGTHIPPYGVAPYYFFYAHAYAADAIEMLPEAERPARREQLRAIFWKIREPDGSWNDRVFERSRSYGTAMTMHALQRPWLEKPATWEAPEPRADDEPRKPRRSAPDRPGR
jgi:hypothetical protein